MADSAYHVAWLMTQDIDLTMRVAASAEQESKNTPNPIPDVEQWARDHKWEWATQADWVAAVTSAIDTGITAWGKSPTVVTDQMILSWVQPQVVGG